MVHLPKSKIDRIEHPQTHYDFPEHLIEDPDLTPEEKRQALNVWEQDARQLLTASNEGMPGSKEGVNQRDHHRLGQVERARDKVADKPKRKASRSSSDAARSIQ